MSSSVDDLIYRAEDTTVEFKSEQYTIAKLKAGTKHSFEQKKSELLKDVLAMANAWRDGPGYIVIGARECKGGPAEIVGLPDGELYDDAVVQQFIGSKLAHALEFTYSVSTCQGKRVGLITIPKQKGRPFYAKNAYGIVQAQIVYVRRGSSTAIADPTEIARMGHDEVGTQKLAEVIVLVNDDAGVPLPDSKHDVIIRDFGDTEVIDDYYEERNRNPLWVDISTPNKNFYRDMAKAIQTRSRAIPVLVSIINKSTFGLRDCKLELLVTDQCEVPMELLGASDFPEYPRRLNNPMTLSSGLHRFISPRHASESMSLVSRGHCLFRFDLIRPGETVSCPEQLAILTTESGVINLAFRLLSGDLPQPIAFECEFGVDVTREHWDVKKLECFLSEKAEIED